ncbi:hypothetical protein FHR38_002826 [Micromonospora polyrhachis]|uniref:Uncharacterized protein n=1 Tax=Micromonospora polyrhachis TaxID=1282883 RepID=A0A7W7SQI2_9ACTN|nr:hypothetical protein [Micromonospora polyrhachis]
MAMGRTGRFVDDDRTLFSQRQVIPKVFFIHSL